MSTTSTFTQQAPTLEDYWRAIILFGSNVASYKFALARALLAQGGAPNELVRLDDLALPFAKEVARHLAFADKQATSSSSRFLDTCRAANRGEISDAELANQTVRLGFSNVIDAFHVVNRADVPVRFFIDERETHRGIRLTTEFFKLQERPQVADLPHEVESRWRLVETAWELNLSRNLVAVDVDSQLEQLVVTKSGRRKAVTSSRSALNGYQKGHCFYCFRRISIVPGAQLLAEVDHFIPRSAARQLPGTTLDGVWNLVLACQDCNGSAGKSARLPTISLLERLHARNEFLVASHHPLRETLIRQTGETMETRRAFLNVNWNGAQGSQVHTWAPTPHGSPRF